MEKMDFRSRLEAIKTVLDEHGFDAHALSQPPHSLEVLPSEKSAAAFYDLHSAGRAGREADSPGQISEVRGPVDSSAYAGTVAGILKDHVGAANHLRVSQDPREAAEHVIRGNPVRINRLLIQLVSSQNANEGIPK